MRVETLGDGDPVLTVVACQHGDEPCGMKAIERLLAEAPDVHRAVKFIVANEEALELGRRFVDEDLNRAFPGDPEADTHEGRLATALLSAIEGVVLDLHSTASHPEPFALVEQLNERTKALIRATGVEYCVDVSAIPGGLIGHVDGVAVECGLKGSAEATENAVRIVRDVLAGQGVVDGEVRGSDPYVYRVVESIGGGDWEFVAENFHKVRAGEPFARHEGEDVLADEEFYPVLMSTNGYDDILGFTAERVGRMSDLE